MVGVTVYHNKDYEYVGFKVAGHAGFAESGKDIVCAAVSILAVNTVNSISKFTTVPNKLKVDEKNGVVNFKVPEPDAIARLFLRSFELGISTLTDDPEYGKYVRLEFKEV